MYLRGWLPRADQQLSPAAAPGRRRDQWERRSGSPTLREVGPSCCDSVNCGNQWPGQRQGTGKDLEDGES